VKYLTIDELVLKYINKAEVAFKELTRKSSFKMLTENAVEEVIMEAERYLKDSIYYYNKNKFEISLASITYCEGLLDALRILKLIDFSWR